MLDCSRKIQNDVHKKRHMATYILPRDGIELGHEAFWFSKFGLWLAGEVVNNVGIYVSKTAEGSSAFQRRPCSTVCLAQCPQALIA